MSAVGFYVRRAQGSDLDAIVGLERACATAPHWGVGVYAEIVAEQGGRRCFFVAEVSEVVVGFAVGMMGPDGMGELESVVVAESARRKGVGRAVCKAVIEWCRANGAMEIALEVRAGSAGAIALYEGLGFVGVGRRVGYYREPEEDAVVMRMRRLEFA